MMDGKNATGLHDRTVGSYSTTPHVTDGPIYLWPLIAVLRPIVIYLSVSLALDDSGEQVLVYIETTRGRQLSTLAEDNPKIEVPYNIRITNCVLILNN